MRPPNKKYMYFRRWFQKSERGFHCSQSNDQDIAHSAFCEGIRYANEQIKEKL